MYVKCGMKLLTHSQTATAQLFKFENWYVITSNTLLGVWLLIHAKRGPRALIQYIDAILPVWEIPLWR